jgi:hypothetical protein
VAIRGSAERAPGGLGSRVPAFPLLAASLFGLALFFILRPALSDLPIYRPRPQGSPFAYWYLVVAAFLPYWWSLAGAGRKPLPRIRVLIAGAAFLYLLFVPAAAQQSQDVYQYLVYGKMAAAGVNPYVVPPVRFPDPWVAFSLWDNMPSVYGPLWTLLTEGVVRMSGRSVGAAFLVMKAIAATLAIGTAMLLARSWSVRGSQDAARFAVVAFAYNPLVVVSVGLGAHADVAVAAALAGGILAERRGKHVLTTLLLVVAALVKVYAGLALVVWLIVLARRRGAGAVIGHGALAAAAVAVAYAPFWQGAATFSWVPVVARLASASLAGTIIRAAAGQADVAAPVATTAALVVRVIGLVVLAAAVVAVARSRRTAADPWRTTALLFGAYVLVAPWYLPWHLFGPLALAAAVPNDRISRALWVFAGTSLIVTSGATLLPAGLAVVGLLIQTVLRYGPPLVAYFWHPVTVAQSTPAPAGH